MRPLPYLVMLLIVLLPAACSEMNPDTRAYIWHPTGVNARNLAAMMEQPSDMVRGRGAPGTVSPLAIAAVNRLMDGKPKALPLAASQTDVVAPAAGAPGAP